MTIRALDHTADVGYEIETRSLAAVYEEAARAFTDVITDPTGIRPTERRSKRVTASDRELLLVEWLDELLYLFETEGWLPADVSAAVSREEPSWTLDVSMAGERFDAHRHELRVPIKAVTLHRLEIREDADRWRARVIFDI